MAYMGGIYAAIAAAAQKKREEEEEELMAEFMRQDQSGDWEYKIVRGTLGAFRSEERMRRVLEKEASASWELAMKMDDERLVLRRPRAASQRDSTLGPDIRPYRTDYGGKTVLLIVAALLLILGAVVFTFTLINGPGGITGGDGVIMMGIMGLMGILVVLGLVVVFLKLRH
jgi:hypothetical protein